MKEWKIAHRLFTIRDADKIMVIGNGGILESGKHDELIEKRDKELFINEVKFSNDIIFKRLNTSIRHDPSIWKLQNGDLTYRVLSDLLGGLKL